MTKETGGSAFPLSHEGMYQQGMTLRDYFAGQVLADCYKQLCIDEAVVYAYKVADAMLKEREK